MTSRLLFCRSARRSYKVFPASGANKFGLVEDVEVDDQGLIYAPEKPGLGYEIDWELVQRETVQVVK